MPLKQFKFTVEFTVNVNDITEETIKEQHKLYNEPKEYLTDSDYLEHKYRQRRLLHTLISDEQVLRKYVTQLFPEFLELDAKGLAESFLLAHNNYDETNEIVMSAVRKLEKEDREFFEEAEEEGVFSENAELFYQAITLDLADISITQTQ